MISEDGLYLSVLEIEGSVQEKDPEVEKYWEVQRGSAGAKLCRKKWRKNNMEKAAAYSRKYYEKNKEKIAASMKKKREANKVRTGSASS